MTVQFPERYIYQEEFSIRKPASLECFTVRYLVFCWQSHIISINLLSRGFSFKFILVVIIGVIRKSPLTTRFIL